MDREGQRASGGAAICIRRNIKHNLLTAPNTSSLETVGINIQVESQRFYIYAAYQRPNSPLHQTDFEQLFTGPPTLVIGDFNCKHQQWGCRETNSNGRKLLEISSNLRFLTLAPEEPTFYPSQRWYSPDILDICLMQNVNLPIVLTSLSELDSDHNPVIISLSELTILSNSTTRLIKGKVDWDLFRHKMDESLTIPITYQNPDEINTAITYFENTIYSAIERATYKFNTDNRPSKYNAAPQYILRLILEKNRMRKRWQRTRDPEDKRMFNRLKRQVKNEFDSYRFQRYEEHLKEITPGDANLWRHTRRLLKQENIVPPLNCGNSSMAVTDEEKCEAFADQLESTFQEDTTHTTLEQPNYNIIRNSHASVELPIKFVTISELKLIFSKFAVKKAPGEDLIPNLVLKKLSDKSMSFLTSVFNACLRTNYFPSIWKNAIILMFNKPGKPKNLPSSYRPISLLNSLSKTLEKIILSRLAAYLYNTNSIPPHQFGFRPLHSTTHQLQRVTEFIVRGFEERQSTVAVSLDISSAFDSVWHCGLLYKLYTTGAPLYLQKIIESFLEKRTFQVRSNNSISTRRNIGRGVPQGSILSPLLFNLFCRDLPTPSTSTLATYADDTLLITKHKHIATATNTLQGDLDMITQWYTKWKLQINSSKTRLKIFTLKHNIPNITLQINNSTITSLEPDQPLKYLGLYLDTRLTWKTNITEKLKIAHQRLIQLYPLINRKSRLRHDCTKLLYTALIRPVLCYACPVWFGASNTHKQKLQVTQNKILRVALNAPWYMRNTQTHRELNIPTIQEYTKTLTQRFHEKLPAIPASTLYNIGSVTRQRRLKPRLSQDVLAPSNQ